MSDEQPVTTGPGAAPESAARRDAPWQPSPATALLLGVGPLATTPTRRTIAPALLCGLAAFLVDVYLY